MAYKIQQYRYFGYNDTVSCPNQNIGLDELKNGFNSYTIIKLGIQSVPGIKFYLNSSDTPIIINGSGIYEIDLTNTDMRITNLKFNETSIKALITGITSGYLIIDMIYEETGGATT